MKLRLPSLAALLFLLAFAVTGGAFAQAPSQLPAGLTKVTTVEGISE